MPAKSIEQRFWKKVNICDLFSCWEWIACKDRHGYGEFNKRFEKKAHRAAWRFVHGDIPPGKLVCHKCDNPSCCNPSHLFLGTPKINSADMVQKNRQARGERNGHAKLVADDIITIRKMLAQGKRKCDIARYFGVSRCTIGDISFSRSWRHL